jgi:hypothetical protein
MNLDQKNAAAFRQFAMNVAAWASDAGPFKGKGPMDLADAALALLRSHPEFTPDEIKHAQHAMDCYPGYSPYWDSRAGQEDLAVIVTLNIQPSGGVRL